MGALKILQTASCVLGGKASVKGRQLLMLAKSNGGQVLDDEEWFKEAYQKAPSQWCGELGRRGNRGRTIGRYARNWLVRSHVKRDDEE